MNLDVVLLQPPAIWASSQVAPRNPFAQMDPSCLPELPTVRALGTPNSNPKLHRGAVPVTSAERWW